MTYREALAYLDGLGRFGVRLGLQRMHALLAALGHPERRIPHVIHVGGTNGKGSVAAMIASVLEAAGLRTALYTSPHLMELTERYRVGGRDVARRRLAAALAAVRPHADALAAAGDPATAFEVLTAAGYLLFAEAGVEWLVQEVGLGGRLDSTNVMERPDVTVITQIGYDHMDRLGHSLRAIAREKAGILRPGCPLVTAAEGEALDVLRRHARRLGAPLVRVVPDGARGLPRGGAAGAELRVRVRFRRTDLGGTWFDVAGDLGALSDLFVPLPGPHQAINGAVAVAALQLAGRSAPIGEGAIRAGLAATRWPGRLEVVRRRPLVLLDGAHNAEGMEALLRSLALLLPGRPLYLVFGLLRDKERTFSALARLPEQLRVRRAWAVAPAAGGRELPAAETARRLQELGIPAQPAPGVAAALGEALQAAAGDAGRGAVCVCGSLYLAGEARALLTRRRLVLRAGA